jgi:hypothetical protein
LFPLCTRMGRVLGREGRLLLFAHRFSLFARAH